MNTNLSSLLQEGTSLHMSGNLSEAEKRYRSLLHEDEGHAVAHNNLGFLLLQKGLLQESMKEYRQAIKLNPGYATAYSNLGQNLIVQKEYDEAEQMLLKAVELDPSDFNANNALAKCYMLKDEKQRAEIFLKRSYAIRQDSEILLDLAWCQLGQGKLDEAGSTLNYGREELRNNPRFFSLWGMIHFAGSNYGNAIFNFRQSLGLEPENIDTRNSLAACLLKTGEGNEARIEMQRILMLQPDHVESLNNLGVLELAAGDHERAAQYFDRVLKADPGDVKALYYQGMTCVHLNKFADARVLLKKVVSAGASAYASRSHEILEFLKMK